MLKSNRKEYLIDLLIIFISMVAALSLFGGVFFGLLKVGSESNPLLMRAFFGALLEYGFMGLGITIVCMIHKESFFSFGLKKDKLLLTLALSVFPWLPEMINTIVQEGGITYFPFQGVHFTKPILASGFPVNAMGIMIIIIVWGFFEGFTYVVIYDRLNKLLPAKSLFLNWGAIICGIFCILIHVVVGQSYNVMEVLCDFSVIYGMLVVYKYTGNAWGCVFIYCLLWNAI